MVEIKMTQGELGVRQVKLDVSLEGCAVDIFASMLEFESAVIKTLEKIEEKTGLNVHEGFIGNITDHFNE